MPAHLTDMDSHDRRIPASQSGFLAHTSEQGGTAWGTRTGQRPSHEGLLDELVLGHDTDGPVTGARLRAFATTAWDATRDAIEQAGPLLQSHARRVDSASEASSRAWRLVRLATAAIAPAFSTEWVTWRGEPRWADAEAAVREAREYQAIVDTHRGPLSSEWDEQVRPPLQAAADRLVVDAAAAPGGKDALGAWLGLDAHLTKHPQDLDHARAGGLTDMGRRIVAQLQDRYNEVHDNDVDAYAWWDQSGSPNEPPRIRTDWQVEDHVLAEHLPNRIFDTKILLGPGPLTAVDRWLGARLLANALTRLPDGTAFPASLPRTEKNLTFLESLIAQHLSGNKPDRTTLDRFESFDAHLDHDLQRDPEPDEDGLAGWRALHEAATTIGQIVTTDKHVSAPAGTGREPGTIRDRPEQPGWPSPTPPTGPAL